MADQRRVNSGALDDEEVHYRQNCAGDWASLANHLTNHMGTFPQKDIAVAQLTSCMNARIQVRDVRYRGEFDEVHQRAYDLVSNLLQLVNSIPNNEPAVFQYKEQNFRTGGPRRFIVKLLNRNPPAYWTATEFSIHRNLLDNINIFGGRRRRKTTRKQRKTTHKHRKTRRHH
jgi:hypothetical protein